MSCVHVGGGIHVCVSRPVERRRLIIKCPTCDRRRRMVSESYEYYGPDLMCCGCGERWQDGEMAERPFCPGWRKQNIARAKRKWIEYGNHDKI